MAEGDVEFGHVVDLTLGEPSGTELVADAAIGATTLTVDYAGDFEDAGEVSLNGTTLPYTAIAYGAAETDPDVITLAAPLAAAALTDDKVVRVSGGEEMSDWLLHVSLGDGHPVDIPIPFEQRALWSNVDPSTPVPVMVSADLERLVEVPGRTPTVDGSLVDASTLDVTALPPVSDGNAPSAATTVTPIGGIGSMFYRWTEVDNADPVTYRLYVRAGASPAALTVWTNLTTQPSFEAAVTEWTAAGGGNAPVQSTVRAYRGTASMLASRGAGTSVLWAQNSLATKTAINKTYTASARLWVPSSNPTNGAIRVSGAGIVAQADVSTPLRDQWVRVSATFTRNATAGAFFYINGGAGSTSQIWVDSVTIFEGIDPGPEFDGDTPDTADTTYAWTGTPYASTSTMTTAALDTSYEVAAGVGLTSASVRKLADGTAIVGDGSVTYHAIVSVEDADGPGPASADVTGIPAQVNHEDIAVNAITVDLLTANDVLADAINATDMTGVNITGTLITGSRFRTASTGRRLEMGLIASGTSLHDLVFYSGGSGESLPGKIYSTGDASVGIVKMEPPWYGDSTEGTPSFALKSGNASGTIQPSADMVAATAFIRTKDFTLDSLTGRTPIRFEDAANRLLLTPTGEGVGLEIGDGTVGTGTFRDSVRTAISGNYAAAWTTYTPTFAASTTNPTLASFTRAGRYLQVGKRVNFSVVITATAASGYGSGTYSFGLPVTARNADEVIVQARQTGPTHVYIGSGDSTTSVALTLTATDVNANATNTGMASGTVLRISGTYEAA